MSDADPINPQRVFWELSPRLPDGAILTADSGLGRELVRARPRSCARGMMASLSGNAGDDGLRRAVRDRGQVRASRPAGRSRCVGDGAMQMNGINELITVAKYWQQWSDPRLVVLVLNNRDLNQVTWEQRAMAGDPKFAGVAGRCPTSPTRATPSCSACDGIRVDDPDEVGAALGRGARAPTGPCVLEAVTDPDVPPLPPHITLRAGQELRPGAAQGRPAARGG